jgi:hypothetical protein
MKHLILVVSILIAAPSILLAQKPNTQFNGFGHVEYALDYTDHADSYFILGEHNFFLTSKLSDKISFLGEYVIRFNSGSATTFLPSIERSFVKFNYKNNHSLILGKIHTPLNYWNDVYHHGRLFFPTVDRPSAFQYFVPLHMLGLQAQGQNLGPLNFGYDVVVGNGIASTDVFDDNVDPAFAVAVHIKPKEGYRIGASYYLDHMASNTYSAHTGHSASKRHYVGPLYKGMMHFSLASFSYAQFTDKVEILNEFSYNRTFTDSLGSANNIANYLYAGIRIKDKHVPYFKTEYMNVSKSDLHTYPVRIQKIALGYKHEFSPMVNVKFQLERYNYSHHNVGSALPNSTALEVQLSYGF